jgi:hypothetical protein
MLVCLDPELSVRNWRGQESPSFFTNLTASMIAYQSNCEADRDFAK